MKKLLLVFLLCFSLVTLTACGKDNPQEDDTQSYVREESGIMNDLIDGVKSIFD